MSENKDMSKIFWNALKLSPVLLGASLLVGTSAQAAEPVPQVQQLAQNPAPDALAQVTSVSQLSDVQPTDWAFQALQSLVERYGCIAGYPDGTYRGNRAMTRYEFAAGLNACLDRVNELIATATADLVTKEDLATLQRLQEEFSAELATLRGRVDTLEAKAAELEANQFSTTTKLVGEVVAAASGAFGDKQAGFANAPGNVGDIENNVTFAARARLNFDTSFNGKDLLRTRLQAANFTPIGENVTGTNMTRLGFDNNTDNAVELDDFFYRFPVGDTANVKIDFANAEFNDNVYTFNPVFEGSGTGSISRFGRFSPIYKSGTDSSNGGAGITINFNPEGKIGASVGYLAENAENPSDASGAGGLLNGNYSAIAQVAFRPTDSINIGATYRRTYQDLANVNLFNSVGSELANSPFGNVPTTSDNFGLEANFRANDKFTIAGWGGFTKAHNESAGSSDSADIYYYGVTLAVQDLGKEGNVLGLIFGQPPKVSNNDVAAREDKDNSYHIEALYKYQLNDNIAITPGLLVILNPEHNNDNDTVYVGTVRTTFTF